jgi:hypothetical protein
MLTEVTSAINDGIIVRTELPANRFGSYSNKRYPLLALAEPIFLFTRYLTRMTFNTFL